MLPEPMLETGPPARRDVVVTRIVHARRPLVWRLWTESRHLAEWWGPHGFTNPECAIDPRPGGPLRIVMRAPDGQEFLNVGTVNSADPPERLVFTVALLNPDGTRRLENLTTVEFVDHGATTVITVRVQVLHATAEASENLAGMRDGWSESLERLAELATKGTAR
jgi:uncharacterized protein YndB with AHSA1/START domain